MSQMAENDQKEQVAKVSPFAIYSVLVAEFVQNLAKARSAQKMASVLNAVKKTFEAENVQNVENVTVADVNGAIEALEKITASVSGEMRETLQKSTAFVEQALETDLVPEADKEAATAAIKAFREASVTSLAPVGKARARQTA